MALTREIWRERWLESINELTSLELQAKSWLDTANSNPHWSFVEFMCCYFDDLAIEDCYKYALNNDLVTSEEFEIISDWHRALGRYNSPHNDDYDNEAILNDPNWLDIVGMGQKVKDKLKKVLTPDEIQILTAERNVA